ncbi:MAG: TIGR04282 family arsenosugar biosynthesis glycosyltransferase [Flavobacteriales bacterium]
MKNKLLIFVKHPEPRKVKTRLAATIGNESALNIYKGLLNITERIARNVPAKREVHYGGKITEEDVFSSVLYEKHLQVNGDLGEKMKFAFEASFESGYEKVVIIGSDCPLLESRHIEQSFELLQFNDVVFGPARDGGYYLLAMRRLIPELFSGISWSTDTVLKDSQKKLKMQGISFVSLETLSDVDEEKDLHDFYTALEKWNLALSN